MSGNPVDSGGPHSPPPPPYNTVPMVEIPAPQPITYPTLSHQAQSNSSSSSTVARNNPFADDNGPASTNPLATTTGNPGPKPPYATHDENTGPQGAGYNGPPAHAGRREGHDTSSASEITIPQNYGVSPSSQNVMPPVSAPRPPQSRGFSTSSEGRAFGGGFDPRNPAARANSLTYPENTGPVSHPATGNSATPVYNLYSRASVDAPGPVRASIPTPHSIPPTTDQPKPVAKDYIYFYNRHEPYYEFTNFSPDPVLFEGNKYPTSEHLFQAMKFMPTRPLLAEHIRTYSDNPRDAFTEARRFQPEWDPNWHTVKIARMDQVLELKFTSTTKLRNLLTKTGDAILVEDSPVDDFWGIGANHQGKNELGKALMRVRKKLQDAPPAPSGWPRLW